MGAVVVVYTNSLDYQIWTTGCSVAHTNLHIFGPSKKRTKSFPSLTAHRTALISVPLVLSQTPAYPAKTTDTGPVHCTVCPFTPQQLNQYQIILLGDRGTMGVNNLPRVVT